MIYSYIIGREQQERRKIHMKFRTRLQVTFITIIILPLVLTALAFFIIGFCLLYHPAKDLTITEIDYSLMSNGIQSYGKITEELYTQIQGELETDIRKAEDLQYLEAKNNEIKKRFSYLIVRKDDQMFYTGDRKSVV